MRYSFAEQGPKDENKLAALLTSSRFPELRTHDSGNQGLARSEGDLTQSLATIKSSALGLPH